MQHQFSEPEQQVGSGHHDLSGHCDNTAGHRDNMTGHRDLSGHHDENTTGHHDGPGHHAKARGLGDASDDDGGSTDSSIGEQRAALLQQPPAPSGNTSTNSGRTTASQQCTADGNSRDRVTLSRVSSYSSLSVDTEQEMSVLTELLQDSQQGQGQGQGAANRRTPEVREMELDASQLSLHSSTTSLLQYSPQTTDANESSPAQDRTHQDTHRGTHASLGSSLPNSPKGNSQKQCSTPTKTTPITHTQQR